MEKWAESYSPLALAYIGDSVFDLMIKDYFVKQKNRQAKKYNTHVTAIVAAKSQAAFMDGHRDFFTDEEMDVYRRGRNAHSHSKARNATIGEYKKATGFEAVIGYLYLSEKWERLDELRQAVLVAAGETEDEGEQSERGDKSDAG